VLLSNPGVSDSVAFGIPAQGEISEFIEAWVAVDWMVKARNYRTASVGHTVAEKLPCTIVTIMRNVCNWLCSLVNGLRKVHSRVRIIWKLPVK
jgi:hypothetical protein